MGIHDTSNKQKKTVLRTIRITEELDGILEKDAKAQRTTVNALMHSIIMKYAEWDRFTERFGHIALPKTLFRAILDLIDENGLATLAEQVGVELTNEITSFWFKKVNNETLLQLLHNSCQYAKIGELEVEDKGRDHTFSIYHEYGPNWSTFWEHYLDKAIRTYLKAIPRIETTENEVNVSFQNP
jgi:hypothetical protein